MKRRIAWVPGGMIVLHDEVMGASEHEIALWFQLPASRGEASGREALLELEGGAVLRIETFAENAEIDVVRPDFDGPSGPGWSSPRYGEKLPVTALRITLGRRALPLRIVTLLAAGGEAGRSHGAELRERDGGLVLRVAGREISFPRTNGVRVEPIR